MIDNERLSRNVQHFDTIAGNIYDDSIPAHVMQHLTRRRVNVVRNVLRTGNDYYGNTIRETLDIAAAVAERFMPHATIGNFAVLIRRP